MYVCVNVGTPVHRCLSICLSVFVCSASVVFVCYVCAPVVFVWFVSASALLRICRCISTRVEFVYASKCVCMMGRASASVSLCMFVCSVAGELGQYPVDTNLEGLFCVSPSVSFVCLCCLCCVDVVCRRVCIYVLVCAHT